jgi:hypothetical protein
MEERKKKRNYQHIYSGLLLDENTVECGNDLTTVHCTETHYIVDGHVLNFVVVEERSTYICRNYFFIVDTVSIFIPELEFLNIYWRLKVDFSRRAVFSKVREYNRALAGYSFFHDGKDSVL